MATLEQFGVSCEEYSDDSSNASDVDSAEGDTGGQCFVVPFPQEDMASVLAQENACMDTENSGIETSVFTPHYTPCTSVWDQ